MTDGRRVTSADVAREAGVSRTTVSFVLNDEDRRIPPETRDRVLAAAERLGFVPYAPARLLRGGRSRLVLVITPELVGAPHEVGADIVARLGERLATSGLDLIWQFGPAAARAAQDLTPALVLASPPEEDAAFTALARRFDVPVLPVFPGLSDFVAAAGTAQVEYLASRGHRAIAFAATEDEGLRALSATREAAVRRAASDRGLDQVAAFVLPADREGGARRLEELLASNPQITAVCAYDDQRALQVLAAAHDLGVAVPARLAVVGVDDLPAAAFSVPALTSVRSDVDEFVSDLATLVEDRIDGRSGAPVALPRHARVVRRASA